MPEKRPALTVALDGIPLSEHPDILREARDLGYRDLWSYEVAGRDGFTPLAQAAMVVPEMRLGIAIANVFSRGPATLAMHACALNELAPGRFSLGIGMGSPATVEHWNGVPYRQLKPRMEEYLTILRGAFAGERVDFDGETVSVKGLRLEYPPQERMPIYVAALRAKMLHFAGEQGDGMITNWLGPDDMPTVMEALHAGVRAAGKDPASYEVAARIPILVDEPDEALDTFSRRMVAGYLNVPTYANFHRWLGNGEELGPMWEAWQSGDRRGAVAAVPERLMKDILIRGSADERNDTIQRYYDAGVDIAIYFPVSTHPDPAVRKERVLGAIRDMAPR
jgi:probable F420-dependent oxidoreductase